MSNIKSNNGTGNKNYGRKSHAIGVGCVTVGDKQMAIGRYPEVPTGDASTDAFIIGGGRSEYDRYTAFRVKENGEVYVGGGTNVYMTNPHTLELTKVFMTGFDNRIKEVLIK